MLNNSLIQNNPWRREIASLCTSSGASGLKSDMAVLNSRNVKGRFDFTLLPEPYIGNPDAPVYLLNLNPSVDDLMDLEDPKEIEPLKERLRAHILCNYVLYDTTAGFDSEEFQKFPFYHLDPNYKCFQGFWWWYRKLRRLMEEMRRPGKSKYESFKIVANSVFNVEFLPYHSKCYFDVGSILPSQEFNFDLVRSALGQQKIIVIMKGESHWTKEIPQLSRSNNVYKLGSSQNSVISEGNMRPMSGKISGKEIFVDLVDAIHSSPA